MPLKITKKNAVLQCTPGMKVSMPALPAMVES